MMKDTEETHNQPHVTAVLEDMSVWRNGKCLKKEQNVKKTLGVTSEQLIFKLCFQCAFGFILLYSLCFYSSQ